ncbi:hypothetical protein [Cloacibacillus porcorum]
MNNEERLLDKKIINDGRRAYLPQPFFQSTIFIASRQRKVGEHRKNGLLVKRQNKWGDIITIKSPLTLFCRPDMGVFLAAMALFQKYIKKEPDFMRTHFCNASDKSVWGAEFPVGELYDLTQTSSDRWSELEASLMAIGSTTISVHYADSHKHGGRVGFDIGGLWLWRREKRNGRLGSLLQLNPVKELVPDRNYLYGDALICNKLKSDTARSIFWALVCREHVKGRVENYAQFCGVEPNRIWDWNRRQFLPALDELQEYKYTIIHNDDDTVTIKRPAGKKDNNKCGRNSA